MNVKFTMVIIAFAILGSFRPILADEICTLAQQYYGEANVNCPDSSAPRPSWQSSIDKETRESHIFFSNGGADLDNLALAQLRVLVPVLETSVLVQSCLHLVGHSDTSGGSDVNQEISLRRAQVVADYLRQQLKDPARVMDVSAAGETQPLAGVQTTSAANRRVAIFARNCRQSGQDLVAGHLAQPTARPAPSR